MVNVIIVAVDVGYDVERPDRPKQQFDSWIQKGTRGAIGWGRLAQSRDPSGTNRSYHWLLMAPRASQWCETEVKTCPSGSPEAEDIRQIRIRVVSARSARQGALSWQAALPLINRSNNLQKVTCQTCRLRNDTFLISPHFFIISYWFCSHVGSVSGLLMWSLYFYTPASFLYRLIEAAVV